MDSSYVTGLRQTEISYASFRILSIINVFLLAQPD